jgi:hypothetical protein
MYVGEAASNKKGQILKEIFEYLKRLHQQDKLKIAILK